MLGLFNGTFQLNMLFGIKCNKIMTSEPVMILEEAVKAYISFQH